MSNKHPVIDLGELHAQQARIGRAFSANPRVVLRCGRRLGKTTLLEYIAAKRAITKGSKIGWFGPQYRLNMPTYSRLSRLLAPVIAHKSKVEQLIELTTGGSIEFWTLNDSDAGRSRFYDLVILDEASLVPGLRDIWEQAIAPTLLDRRGNAIMAGTPKGVDSDNYFYTACTDQSLGWLEFHVPTSANPMLDPVAVAKLKDDYPPLVYQQEYLAEFVDWSGVAFFSLDKLLSEGQPVDIDWRGDTVFATIDTASKDGMEHDGTGVIYWLKSDYAGVPLTILDWDLVNINADLLTHWIPGIQSRLTELANDLKARRGSSGSFIEDRDSGIALNQAAHRLGINSHPINEEMTSIGKEGRAIAASSYFHQGKVKISRYAFDKTVSFHQQTKCHVIDQVCSFRIGQKKAEHKKDLLDCFAYGILIALGDSEGF